MACRSRIDELRLTGSPPDAVLADVETRARVLARAKAEPVLFVRAPAIDPAESARARYLRNELVTRGYRGLDRVMAAVNRQPALAREVLLREGYFYVDDSDLAALLVEAIELRDLFDDDRLVLERGSKRYTLARTKDGDYLFADGVDAGRKARLLLYDRLWSEPGAAPGPRLHRDVRGLSRKLGFDRLRVDRVQGNELVVELRYGADWLPAIVRTGESELELGCEVVPEEASPRIAAVRARRARHDVVHERLRAAISEQVDEALPFDEPRTEDGQQDGKLRHEWRMAHRTGRLWFEFNEDRYWVYDSKGRPRVPQVCIDFITDTLERASGTWWTPRGTQPARVRGRLDFGALGISNQRSVETFVSFAWEHPELFDVVDVEPEERVPFRRRRAFFDHLFLHRDRYAPGDIIAILGLRDDDKLHYHSFFVFDADPVTGMPTLVASNAGRPRLRSWEHELQNAPKRSLRTRIRPRLEWLEALVIDQTGMPTKVAGDAAESAGPEPGKQSGPT